MNKHEYMEYHKTLCDEARLNMCADISKETELSSVPTSHNPRKVICGIIIRVLEKCKLHKYEVFAEAAKVQKRQEHSLCTGDLVQACINRLTLDFTVLEDELRTKNRTDVLKRRCVLIVNTLIRMCSGLDNQKLSCAA